VDWPSKATANPDNFPATTVTYRVSCGVVNRRDGLGDVPTCAFIKVVWIGRMRWYRRLPYVVSMRVPLRDAGCRYGRIMEVVYISHQIKPLQVMLPASLVCCEHRSATEKHKWNTHLKRSSHRTHAALPDSSRYSKDVMMPEIYVPEIDHRELTALIQVSVGSRGGRPFTQ